jgi:hypothetical protein
MTKLPREMNSRAMAIFTSRLNFKEVKSLKKLSKILKYVNSISLLNFVNINVEIGSELTYIFNNFNYHFGL